MSEAATLDEARPSLMEGADQNTLVAQLQEVFGTGFRIAPPSRTNPYFMIYHEDRCAAAVHRIDELLIQSGDIWNGFDGRDPIVPVDRLAAVREAAGRHTRIDPDRIAPFLWLANAVADDDSVDALDPRVVVGPMVHGLDLPVRGALSALGAMMAEGSDIGVCRAIASASAVRAGIAERASGKRLGNMIAALMSTLEQSDAIGDRKLTMNGIPFTIFDICNSSYLLPAVAICAHEDWRMATTRRASGTGFTVSLFPDQKALFGFRVTDIHPAVPFVALGPITSCLLRHEVDGVIVLDKIVDQFLRWIAKNDQANVGVVLVSAPEA